MHGLSNKLMGCPIKYALIVGLLVSLAWALPVQDDKKPLTTENNAASTEQPIEAAPVMEEAENVGQLRFPPFNNNGTKFFERFGQKFRSKWTPSTTMKSTAASAP